VDLGAGLKTDKSLVIIAISALRASALAIFSVNWFKLGVLRDTKFTFASLITSNVLNREDLERFKIPCSAE